MPSETAPTSHEYAQTNLQLYNQLLALGYDDAEVRRVYDAHELAMRLFTAQYQPSGKPTLAHVVGTASILAAQRAPTDVVCAGLLHAAYSHGLFRWWIAAPARRRRLVRDRIGSAAEHLVARYAKFRWSPGAIRALRARLEELDAVDRRVLLIRLANELEDQLDLGMHFCGEGAFHDLYCGAGLDILVEAATELGFPDLATALDQTIRASNQAMRPAGLRRAEHRPTLIAPGSESANTKD